jgi:nitrous oxidase accessory protein NosD
MSPLTRLSATTIFGIFALPLAVFALEATVVEVRTYPTLQAAIDANPGKQIRIPAGDYTIDRALTITHDGTELYGPARIVQTNPKAPIVRIDRARGIRLSDLTFTRAADQQEAEEHGIVMTKVEDIELSHLRVSENHSHSTIYVRDGRDVTVANCVIVNYKGLAIDDRTKSSLYGYAFKAIDGTGIQMYAVHGAIIRDNRIQEYRLLPTKETRDKYDVGTLTTITTPGQLAPKEMLESRYTNNWHQGSAIQVTTPDKMSQVMITGNYIENPAQGIDIHADNVIVSNNIVSHGMMGMKAMHGSKHVLIDGNQFDHVDLWGVMLMPGAASHVSANAADGKPAATENVDGGHIVSNNIFSNFGFGEQYWNWADNKPRGVGGNVIALLGGQIPENPPLHNVLVTGNVVYDSGQDTKLVDGQWTKLPPRYKHALYVEQEKEPKPANVLSQGNLFDPGYQGVSNLTK